MSVKEIESSIVIISRLVWLFVPITALNWVLIISPFLNIVVIILVSVTIDFDLYGNFVVAGTTDDLRLVVFHNDHIFIALAFKIDVHIDAFARSTIVKAAWNWHFWLCHDNFSAIVVHCLWNFVKFFLFIYKKLFWKLCLYNIILFVGNEIFIKELYLYSQIWKFLIELYSNSFSQKNHE